MKKIATLICFGICLTAGAQSWYQQTSPVSVDLLCIEMVTPVVSYASGKNGTVLKTTDGGTNWTDISPASMDWFYDIHALSTDEIWVSGTNGALLHTVDGGANWTIAASGTTNMLYGMTGSSSSVLYVAGDGGTILKTTDGGTTWNALTTGTTADLRDVVFTGANKMVAVGDAGTIIVSNDAGATWNAATSSTTNMLRNVESKFGVTLAVGISGSTVHKSVDGGDTWTGQSTYIGNDYLGVEIFSAVNYAVVGTYATIQFCTDGSTWDTPMSNPASNTINSISGTGPSDMHACGDGGKIIRYGSATGVTEVSIDNSLSVYPNPANDRIRILTDEECEISILNALGQTIVNVPLIQSIDLNISEWKAGVYFVKNTQTGVTERFVVQ
jgi:photosystem II stability/assembly factor-like uncharacterized protein